MSLSCVFSANCSIVIMTSIFSICYESRRQVLLTPKAAVVCVYQHVVFFRSMVSGGQQEAVQGGGKRPSGWSDGSRLGLEQTQAAERVHHRSTVPGPVQVHCAVSDLPSQVPDIWDLYVPFTASGLHQQVLPAGRSDIKHVHIKVRVRSFLLLFTVWERLYACQKDHVFLYSTQDHCWGQWETVYKKV